MRKIHALIVALPTLLMLGCDQKPKPTTAADAAALQAELHDWFAAQVNPLLPANVQPVTVAPEGTGFRLRIDIPASGDQFVPQGLALSLKATRGKEGVWQFDDYALPSSLTIKLPAAMQVQPGQPANPNFPPPPQELRVSVAHSSYHGTFDPSLKQNSHLEGAMEGFKYQVGNIEVGIGKSSSTNDLLPAANGLVDFKAHGSSDDMREQISLPNGMSGEIGWAHDESSSQILAVSLEQLRGAIQDATRLIATARQNPNAPPGTDQVAAIVDKLLSLADSASGEMEISGFHLQFQAVNATAEHAHIAASLGSAAGRPRVSYRIQLQNFDVPSVATGAWHELMPHNITLAFGLGGVPKERLLQYLHDTSAAAGAGTPAQMMVARQVAFASLLTDGADFSIDELAFNLGETSFTGHAQIHVMPAQQVSAVIDIMTTGLDKLMSRASQDPVLAQSVPVLAMARGLAKTEGDKQSWHIEAANNGVLINGVDLRSLNLQRPQAAPAPANPPPPALALPPPSKP